MLDARENRRGNHKTMTENMGFKDPDLRCPKHDQMSFALANIGFIKKLLASALDSAADVHIEKVKLEWPITKGDGQYKTIVGFADAAVLCYPPSAIPFKAIIEAKPQLKNPMEVLRQLNTYREILGSMHNFYFLLWCPEISKEQKNIFVNQEIFVSDLQIPGFCHEAGDAGDAEGTL